MIKKIFLLLSMVLGVSNTILSSHKEEGINLEEFNSVVEASLMGSLVLVDDTRGLCINYRDNEQFFEVTKAQLRKFALAMRACLKDVQQPVTVAEKLSLFGAKEHKKSHNSLKKVSEEQVLQLQIIRMNYFTAPLCNKDNREALIEEITTYKENNKKKFEELFPGCLPDNVAKQLLFWHEIIAKPVNISQENYHTTINEYMCMVATMPLKSIAQEAHDLPKKKKKANKNSSNSCLPLFETW